MITIAHVVVGTALVLAPAPLPRDARPDFGTPAPAILYDSVPSERLVPASPTIRFAASGHSSEAAASRSGEAAALAQP